MRIVVKIIKQRKWLMKKEKTNKEKTLMQDPRLWNKKCYWEGEVPKDFLGGKNLREPIRVE